MSSKSDSKICILTPTRDAVSDVWPIAAMLRQRFWPDCRYRTYWEENGTCTNEVPAYAEPVFVHAMEDRIGWGRNILESLDQIPKDYEFILHFQEEVLILGPVNDLAIAECVERLENDDRIGLALIARYYSSGIREEGSSVGFVPNHTNFGCGLPIIWRRDLLRRVAQEFPLPNLFEQKACAWIKEQNPGIRACTPTVQTFRFCDNAMACNGNWMPCVPGHLKELGIENLVDTSIRGISHIKSRFPDGCPG